MTTEPTPGADDTADALVSAEPTEREWWEDPSLPWKHKPTREDYWCWGVLSAYGIYGMIMLPLRPWLLTVPFVSAWLNGSRTALVAVGALTAVNPGLWGWTVATWLVASVSVIKFDWIFWWAGKLWGHGIIEAWGGKSESARRFSDSLQHLALKHPTPAIAVSYLPIPFTPVIYAALGAARLPVKRFMVLDLLVSLVFSAGYLALGYAIGEPAVELLKVYSNYALWFSLALLIVVIAQAWWRARKQATRPPGADVADREKTL